MASRGTSVKCIWEIPDEVAISANRGASQQNVLTKRLEPCDGKLSRAVLRGARPQGLRSYSTPVVIGKDIVQWKRMTAKSR